MPRGTACPHLRPQADARHEASIVVQLNMPVASHLFVHSELRNHVLQTAPAFALVSYGSTFPGKCSTGSQAPSSHRPCRTENGRRPFHKMRQGERTAVHPVWLGDEGRSCPEHARRVGTCRSPSCCLLQGGLTVSAERDKHSKGAAYALLVRGRRVGSEAASLLLPPLGLLLKGPALTHNGRSI